MKITRKKASLKKILLFSCLSAIVLFVVLAVGVQYWYKQQLKPVTTSSNVISVDIEKGQSPQQISSKLQDAKIIRNSQAFLWYLRQRGLMNKLQAGHYELDSSKTTNEVVNALTSGDVATKQFTILPGRRLDQIKQKFLDSGFSKQEVEQAFLANNYANHPALVAKPASQNLEGYIFPDTFNLDTTTKPNQIIEQSLGEMAKALSPDVIDAFQKNGLTIYQGITLASIIEKEASGEADKRDIAAVFYNRLKKDMNLQSDVTYHYGAYLLGVEPTNTLNSPYNTYRIKGLPPGPISNVSKSSLQAAAYPSQAQYLFFVAGDNGKTYFANTLEEHDALAKQYCQKKCSTY